MIIPKVEQIAAAAQLVKTLPISVKQSELEQLRQFGQHGAISIGAAGLNPSFMTGYLLGLETARVYLADVPAYVDAKVEF